MSVALPTFRQLLARLGYGDLGQPKTTILVHDVLVFLKAANPVDDSSLLSNDAQFEAYSELACHFLNLLGRGNIYWPDTGRTDLVYAVEHRRIQTLVVCLFIRFSAEMRRWGRTSAGRTRDVRHDFSIESLLTDCKAENIIHQGIIFDYMANPRHIGSFKFRYSLGEDSSGYMSYTSWEPPQEFKANSLLELMSELPRGNKASGIRVSFSGPGFCIRGVAFDESDFGRLKVELNDQVCRLLVNRKSVWDNFNVHVQIMLLKGGQPVNPWIFSE